MLIKFFRFSGRDPELLMVRAPDLMDLKLPAIMIVYLFKPSN